MKLGAWHSLVFGSVVLLGVPSITLANDVSSVDMELKETEVSSALAEINWQWLSGQIKNHPDVVAAREQMNSELALSEGASKSLYNPEFATDWEREGEEWNYAVGLNQTLDWSDKRQSRTQQAVYDEKLARANFQWAYQRKLAEGLTALIEWRLVDERARRLLTQERQLNQLLDVIKSRQETGDLGEVDTELAFLGLSQTLNEVAKAKTDLALAETKVREAFVQWQSGSSQTWLEALQSGLSAFTDEKETNGLSGTLVIDQHPLVKAAKARWQSQQAGVEVAEKDAKADPTLGVSTGETAEEQVIGVSFSIPLNILNDYSDQVRAANRSAVSAEANYMSVLRNQQLKAGASESVLSEYQQRFERWQTLTAGRAQRSADLLDRYWRNGEMSTSEYILALKQRAADLSAGAELKAAYQIAQVEWLLQRGAMPIPEDVVSLGQAEPNTHLDQTSSPDSDQSLNP